MQQNKTKAENWFHLVGKYARILWDDSKLQSKLQLRPKPGGTSEFQVN